MKPVILEGGGIMLVVGDCSHEREQVTHGPTTDQINHWCPDCRRHWTTWPDRTSGVASVAPALPLVVEEIAKGWDGCMYDAPGGEIDVGHAIRAHAEKLLADGVALGEEGQQ